MKLLFDQNLSFRLVRALSDVFPESNQVRLVALDKAADEHIWKFAKDHEFTIVTQDSDFADMAALYGSPPKVIWLRFGNQPNEVVESILKNHAIEIQAFEFDESSCLELF